MSSERSPTSERRDEFLTVAEIAERLEVNQQSVRNWIDGGLLAAVRVGNRRVRVRESALDEFLATGAERIAADDRWYAVRSAAAAVAKAARAQDEAGLEAAISALSDAARALRPEPH